MGARERAGAGAAAPYLERRGRCRAPSVLPCALCRPRGGCKKPGEIGKSPSPGLNGEEPHREGVVCAADGIPKKL